MNPSFKIGAICIGQNFVQFPERNGMECEIIGELKERRGRGPTGKLFAALSYRVHWADGKVYAVRPRNLRLKKPPVREIDTVVSWETCAWRPKMKQLEGVL